MQLSGNTLPPEQHHFEPKLGGKDRRTLELALTFSWGLLSFSQIVAGVLLVLYLTGCRAPTNVWLVLDGILSLLLMLVLVFLKRESLHARINWKNAHYTQTQHDRPRGFSRKEWEDISNGQRQVANRRETVIGCTKIVCGIPLIGMNLAFKVTGQSWFWLELFPTECDSVSYGFTLLFVSLQLGMALATSCWWFLYREPPQEILTAEENGPMPEESYLLF